MPTLLTYLFVVQPLINNTRLKAKIKDVSIPVIRIGSIETMVKDRGEVRIYASLCILDDYWV